jgi:hypothetical protein
MRPCQRDGSGGKKDVADMRIVALRSPAARINGY